MNSFSFANDKLFSDSLLGFERFFLIENVHGSAEIVEDVKMFLSCLQSLFRSDIVDGTYRSDYIYSINLSML